MLRVVDWCSNSTDTSASMLTKKGPKNKVCIQTDGGTKPVQNFQSLYFNPRPKSPSTSHSSHKYNPYLHMPNLPALITDTLFSFPLINSDRSVVPINQLVLDTSLEEKQELVRSLEKMANEVRKDA